MLNQILAVGISTEAIRTFMGMMFLLSALVITWNLLADPKMIYQAFLLSKGGLTVITGQASYGVLLLVVIYLGFGEICIATIRANVLPS